MKVKDLIKSLSQYNQELDIIFCDSSYGSIDDEYDDMMVAAAPSVDVCWTGIE